VVAFVLLQNFVGERNLVFTVLDRGRESSSPPLRRFRLASDYEFFTMRAQVAMPPLGSLPVIES
jgi:hypothetical protein